MVKKESNKKEEKSLNQKVEALLYEKGAVKQVQYFECGSDFRYFGESRENHK